MDQRRLSRGDQIIGVSALALVSVSFLNWLGGDHGRLTLAGAKQSLALPNSRFTINAWGSTPTVIAELIGIGMLVYVALKVVGLDLPTHIGTLTAGQVTLGLGIAAFALVLIKLIAGTHGDLNSFGLPNLPARTGGALRLAFHKTREPGIVVGLIAAAGLTAGGFVSVRGEQTGGGT